MTNLTEVDRLRKDRDNWKYVCEEAVKECEAHSAEIDRLHAAMTLAHAAMRDHGWQLAVAAETQGDGGVLEAACTEIEAAFSEILEGPSND